MHLYAPLIGSDGTAYGICGFEISESYFKNHFAQATQISHLTCLLTKSGGDKLNPSDGFAAGVFNGYYLAPSGEMSVESFGKGLSALDGSCAYVGKLKTVTLCNESYWLAVMIPKSEYTSMATENTLRAVCLVLLLFGVIVAVCIFFSRKFLSPLLKDLEQIRKQERKEATSAFAEIDDLFVFLAEQDRLHDEEKEALRRERDGNASILESQRAEINRLAYSRKSEIDPDDYETFKNGIKTLTRTERTVFELYISGKTAKEITVELGIRESTLKYHNHNILSKLNVSSRKQMLRYATLLKQENGD